MVILSVPTYDDQIGIDLWNNALRILSSDHDLLPKLSPDLRVQFQLLVKRVGINKRVLIGQELNQLDTSIGASVLPVRLGPSLGFNLSVRLN